MPSEFLHRGALRLWRLCGIDLYVHWSFLLLLLIFLGDGARAGGSTGALWGLATLGLVFACVYPHELGHALAARRLGLPVDRITLWPLGGLAELGEAAPTPRIDLLMTAAGPAVNFVAAALAYGLYRLVYREGGVELDEPSPGAVIAAGNILYLLFWINLTLGLFNLLPMFPLDGGRLLQGLLALRWGGYRSARAACWTGLVLAVLLGVLGFYTREMLLPFICLWSFFVCWQTLRALEYGMPPYAAWTEARLPTGNAFGYGVGEWRAGVSLGDTRLVENAAAPSPSGLLARWRARRAARRAAREAAREAELRRRVDELLAKVAAGGLGSLSESEKAFLNEASRQYQRRD